MIKSLKCLLVFTIIATGLSGCTSIKETADLQKAQTERENAQKELQQKQAAIIEKVDQLTVSVQQWQNVQPGVERLANIENELNGLISQLNMIVDQAKKEKMPPAVKKSKAAGKFYALQLISVGNAKMVEKSWSNIYKKSSNILTDDQPLIAKVQIKNKTYYRIKAGKFSSKNQAGKVCAQLKKQNVSCLLSAYSGQTLRQFKAENE